MVKIKFETVKSIYRTFSISIFDKLHFYFSKSVVQKINIENANNENNVVHAFIIITSVLCLQGFKLQNMNILNAWIDVMHKNIHVIW